MMTRRDVLKTIVATGAAFTMASSHQVLAANLGLSWQYFPAGEHGFFRAPVLVSGQKEAILIDAGFTFSDAKDLVEAIKATGKTLTTIYISQSDPDYYFGLAKIKAAFPNVKVIAATDTIVAMKASVEKKLTAWGPQLKENGPQSLADIVMPEIYDGPALSLEGKLIEIINANGLPNRRYLSVPSINAIFGGVLVFSGVHVWTADTNSVEARAAWIQTLETMIAQKPIIVIPGHISPGAAIDATAITYTKNYLQAFEEALAQATNSKDLIAAMTKRYPDAGMGIALQIGAKVATGEMQWG
jgi:glyoxylase-like metal-dependent hydrolase (beta-lactamase superfamily II)